MPVTSLEMGGNPSEIFSATKMVHLYYTMKSFLVLILEIRLAFPPLVKSFIPPFPDSLCVSLGIVKTILYARSLEFRTWSESTIQL